MSRTDLEILAAGMCDLASEAGVSAVVVLVASDGELSVSGTMEPPGAKELLSMASASLSTGQLS